MAKHHLSIDIETRSSVDISKAGVYKYAQSPDFKILLFAYQWDDGPVDQSYGCRYFHNTKMAKITA